MKLNLDEKSHTNVAPALHAQGLAGHPDADHARVVRAEKRVLITSHPNFADPRLCSP